MAYCLFSACQESRFDNNQIDWSSENWVLQYFFLPRKGIYLDEFFQHLYMLNKFS